MGKCLDLCMLQCFIKCNAVLCLSLPLCMSCMMGVAGGGRHVQVGPFYDIMHCRKCARPPSSLRGSAPLLWFSTSTSIPSCTSASVRGCCTWACTLHAAACCSAFLLSWWSATVWSASCLLMPCILVAMKLLTNHCCLLSVVHTSVGIDSSCCVNKVLHACLVLPAKSCYCWW